MLFRKSITGLALLLLCAGAAAQAPNKIIRLVVPFAPGGGQDILARTFSNELGAGLGQPVIVEYHAGAGGTVGSSFVARSDPQNPAFLVGAASHMISALISPHPAYDPVKDFTAVVHIGTGAQVLLVNAKLPVNSVAEFVAYAKAHPGKLNFGSAGSGSSTHLAMAYFANVAGIDMVHIPFKSNSQPIQALIAGRIQAGFLPGISAASLAKDSRVKILGVSTRERLKFMPSVPSIAQSGFPDYVYGSWFGLLGPANADKSLVQRINAEMGKILRTPAIVERLQKLGIEASPMSVEAFADLLRTEYDRLAHIVKISGAKPG
jgi:tripartite-type tricarboxylate transporter receptor subunit TctC